MIRAEGDEEIENLKKFKKHVEDLKQTDVACLRFLRARDGNLDKAEGMLRRCLKWREDIQVSTYLTWRPTKCVAEDTTFEFTGVDIEGRPVFWLPMGRWNARGWVEKGYKEDIAKLRYYILETIMYQIGQSKADQCVVIFGVEGLTYWKVAHVETMQIMMDSFKDLAQYYPEIIKSMFVVNTPWYFPYVMTFVKPLLSARTAKKVQIFNSDRKKWLPTLLETIPESSIPKEYLEIEDDC